VDALAYETLARHLMDSGIIADPYVLGEPRFSSETLLLAPDRVATLNTAAEAACRLHHAVGRVVAASPELLDHFLCLTPVQKLMWQASHPRWHLLARADVFETENGPLVCELNADTPTGEAEAVLLSRYAAAYSADVTDPNALLEQRFCDALESAAVAGLDASFPRTCAIIYPTEIPEDLALVRLYRGWLEARGWQVVLGSPFNVQAAADGGVTVLGTQVSVVIRHYKTDGWGERAPVWDDESPYVDAAPLLAPLHALLNAEVNRRCVVVNPFGCVLMQNKRCMALLWEESARFSTEEQALVERYIPRTWRMELMAVEELAANRERYVLKSDYGAEGNEVLVGALTTETHWKQALVHAVPGRWVVQERFHSRTQADGAELNLGVFVVGGQAAGLYVRSQHGPTNGTALSVPVLVQGRAQ